jgi:uncharacterized low-complexity protein
VQPSLNLRVAVCYIGAVNWKAPCLVALLGAALLPAVCAGQVASQVAGQAAGQAAPAHRVAPAQGSSNGAAGDAAPGANGSEAGSPASTECDGGPCPATPTPHITIATPAPAPPTWQWQDRIRWAAEIVLAILAYVGVMLAIAALRKIERQTQYAESAAQAAAESAKAALEYAQAHARTERPWLLISAEPAPGAPDAFTVVASNRGRGPARVQTLMDGIAIAKDELSLPPEPAYMEAESNPQLASMILLPGESIGIRSFRRDEVVRVCKTADQLQRVENWEEKIYLYGKVNYVDLQAPNEKQIFETAWCCWYIHGRQRSGLVMAGKPPYNQHS